MDIGNRRDMVKRSRTIKGETVVKLFRMIAVKVGRPIRARSGNSMVEFALVAPLFFLLVFGILDYGRLFYIQETLQYAMRQAGRYAVTGQKMGGSRVAAITQVAENAAAGLINSGNVNSILITSVNTANGTTQTNNAGTSGQEMTITMVSNLKLITPGIAAFFPNGTYTFTNSVTFRNEPFTGDGT
jgi:Flp pilus assembly protein TadG